MPAVGNTLLMRVAFTWVSAGLSLGVAAGCGIETHDRPARHAVLDDTEVHSAPEGGGASAQQWSWPSGPRERARLEVRGLGAIEIELFSELAPRTVENFRQLASSGFYDGTTFHRVIPGFMIQGGDPLSRNRDPSDDGSGGPGYRIRDEFSRAPHLRGAVSMANRSSPNSGGSQFFIVHQDSQHLDRHYSLFGRVVSGMDVVDRVATAERDAGGRWGPRDRPIESVVIDQLLILPAGTAAESRTDPADSVARATPP